MNQGEREVTRTPVEDGRRVVGADRVLAVLSELAAAPAGISLEALADQMGQNKATVHHALGALRRAGFARQQGRGRYVLGDELLRLAFAHYQDRPEDPRIAPLLQRLVARFGETVHHAVLDGREIVYRQKLDPPAGAVRLTSTIGGRNPSHSTGVGKALLAYRLLDLDAVRSWVGDGVLEARTARTAVTPEDLHSRLEEVRANGYATDDRENEDVVNCLALPLFFGPGPEPTGAVSISALVYRTPLAELVAAVDEVRSMITEIGSRQELEA